ncbi:hypothetical protein JTB14_023477 [Gonioctena quinquepunctata]|nr:hypothetical protein JTB14_023477 [Gonioctena quinquepunctata]
MQAGIDALDANSKPVSHGDSPTVWRFVDEYLREKKLYSNDIYQRYDNNAAAVTAATANDDNFPYYRLFFVYYRYQHDILASPIRVLLHLSAVTSGHTDAIMLIQLHFGTVAAHNDQLPLFLYLPTATRLFHRGANKTLCRCCDTKHEGYVTCWHPFGIAAYPEIYFQTYDPTYHTVLNQRQANMTLYTIFGDYKTGTPYIKGKMAFMSNFIESHRHRLNQLTNNLRLHFEIYIGFDIYINLVANMFIVNNDDDDNNENHHDITLGTLRKNWRNHLTATGITYLANFVAARQAWQESPHRDAARRMYDAEIKLRYFNEGNSRQYIDYDHLEKMIGGHMLIGHEAGEDDDDTNDNIGLVKYIIHDEDAQHRLATQFQLQYIRIISCNIPLEWYKEFVHVFLIAAEKYDVYRKPHVVLMKVIAHMANAKYGPELHTWTHIESTFERNCLDTTAGCGK